MLPIPNPSLDTLNQALKNYLEIHSDLDWGFLGTCRPDVELAQTLVEHGQEFQVSPGVYLLPASGVQLTIERHEDGRDYITKRTGLTTEQFAILCMPYVTETFANMSEEEKTIRMAQRGLMDHVGPKLRIWGVSYSYDLPTRTLLIHGLDEEMLPSIPTEWDGFEVLASTENDDWL